MSAYFVTATGTEIGKTFVTAGLIRHLRRIGEPANVLKPVISGFDAGNPHGSDSGILLDAMEEEPTALNLNRVSPWRFAPPLSPDMAAEKEERAIAFHDLVAFSRNAIGGNNGTLFIEGVGGVMVPLDDRHLVLDWMKALALPLILVTGSYLGTLSHTLTALEVLRHAGLTVCAVIVNESADSPVALEDTVASLTRFARARQILVLHRNPERRAFADLWTAIERSR